MSHTGISTVKGMLLKGQAFLSSNLKRAAIEHLDSATNEFIALKLEVEQLKGEKATLQGELAVVISENGALKAENQSLSEALQSRAPTVIVAEVPPTMSDDAHLVPVVITEPTI